MEIPKNNIRSQRLRRIMERRPSFWLSSGIALTFIIFILLFLLALYIPIERLGGVSIVDYILH